MKMEVELTDVQQVLFPGSQCSRQQFKTSIAALSMVFMRKTGRVNLFTNRVRQKLISAVAKGMFAACQS